MNKKILIFCIVAGVGMLCGCNANTNELLPSTNEETSKKNTSSSNKDDNNDLFRKVEKETTSINLIINDQLYEISDSNKISSFFEYLSSLDLEIGEDPEKYGGRIVDIVTSDDVKALVLYETDFLYDGKFYCIKNEGVDITTEVTDILKN